MPDFHDINHPGFSFFPSKQKEPEGEEITEIEEQKPEEKKDPEVRFLSAKFKPHELHGYTINKPVIVEGSVEYLRPTKKTRVEIELYGTYNDKEEECFVVDRRKRYTNIKDDNTFKFEIPLYCPFGYDHYKNRDRITDPLSYRAEITHSAHEKPLDNVKLDLPDGTENPVLQKGMYDDKACEFYPDRCTKDGEGYLEGSPVAKLQEILIKFRYLDQNNPDGDFGKKTDAAVRSFQKDAMKDKRLHTEEIKVVTADETRFKGPVDGIVGPKTRSEIDFWQRHKWARPVPDFYKGDYDYESVMQKKREYQGDDFHDDYPIKKLQEKFQKVNLYQGFDIDGIFEDKMKSAVEEFQDLAEKGEFAAVADNTRVVNVKPLSGYRKGVLCYKTQDCLKEVVEKEGVVESKNIIKKGDQGKIVEEINIRLSGFGGGVPSDKFDITTETKIMNFQRDYMGMEKPTGILDEETAKGIDEFGRKYCITNADFNDAKCSCNKCDGFGMGRNKSKHSTKPHIEAYHTYEYPGIHISLFWALFALQYHLSVHKDVKAKFLDISSGYRCHEHPIYKKTGTTNHLGKALDLRFYSLINEKWIRPEKWKDLNKTVEAVRKNCTDKSHLNAQYRWNEINRFSMETTKDGADTWVHIDIRKYDSQYLDDKYFCKTYSDMMGEKLIILLKDNS